MAARNKVQKFIDQYDYLKSVKVDVMRQVIPQLVMLCDKRDPSQKKVKGLWKSSPGWWNDSIPYEDPNNGKQKPNRDVLKKVLDYLVGIYKNNGESSLEGSLPDPDPVEECKQRITQKLKYIKKRLLLSSNDVTLYSAEESLLQQCEQLDKEATLKCFHDFECKLDTVITTKTLPSELHKNGCINEDYPSQATESHPECTQQLAISGYPGCETSEAPGLANHEPTELTIDLSLDSLDRLVLCSIIDDFSKPPSLDRSVPNTFTDNCTNPLSLDDEEPDYRQISKPDVQNVHRFYGVPTFFEFTDMNHSKESSKPFCTKHEYTGTLMEPSQKEMKLDKSGEGCAKEIASSEVGMETDRKTSAVGKPRTRMRMRGNKLTFPTPRKRWGRKAAAAAAGSADAVARDAEHMWE